MLRLSGLRLDRGTRTLYRNVNVTGSDGEPLIEGVAGAGENIIFSIFGEQVKYRGP